MREGVSDKICMVITGRVKLRSIKSAHRDLDNKILDSPCFLYLKLKGRRINQHF